MLRQTETEFHPYYDYESVRVFWEDGIFEVDGVCYSWLHRNPHGSRLFTLKADYRDEDFDEEIWDCPMYWKPSGDNYWDNRSSP